MESVNPKISVIVPVYKAEKYLTKCVDSLLSQTFTDFEVLLIDDGSPDDSGIICDAYASKDERIRVFHKKNGGVSSARQCGIDNAQGEYTIHCDPDDWVEPNMLEELYAKAKETNADMVLCDYYINYSHKSIYKLQIPSSLESDIVLSDLLMGKLHGSLWNKLIKRNLILKYHVNFENMIIWEDLCFVSKLLLHPITISYLNKAYYHYVLYENSNSLTKNVSKRRVDSQRILIDFLEKNIDTKHFEKELLELKCLTKELAWYSRLYSYKEFYNIYVEVNEFYLKTDTTFLSIRYFVKLALLGHDTLSYNMYSFLQGIKERILKILKLR